MSRTSIPKVVHLTSVHARYDNRILYKQCASLAKSDFDTYLIVADGKGNEDIVGVHIIDVGKSRGLLDRVLRIVWKIYRTAKALNAHAYELHDPELLPVAFLLYAQGKKIIYDVHEDYRTSIAQKKYLNKAFKILFTGIYAFFEKRAEKRFTLLLAEKYYKEHLPTGHVILNYPLVDEVDREINLASSIPNNSNNQSLLYTGNVTEVRGAMIQSKLVDQVEGIAVTFIGYCPRALADKMRDQTRNKEKLHFVGIDEYIPQHRIKQAYKQGWLAGLALFPKTKHYEKKELTKFFEYMLNGLPIICSDFPAWKTFVEENQCGFAVDPADYRQINQIIKHLIQHPELRGTMGNNGKQRVLEELNWTSQEKTLIQLYKELIP